MAARSALPVQYPPSSRRPCRRSCLNKTEWQRTWGEAPSGPLVIELHFTGPVSTHCVSTDTMRSTEDKSAAGLVEPEPLARKQRTMKELAICVLRAICTDDDETDDNQAAHRDLSCTSSMILQSMHLLMHQSMHNLTHTCREQAAQKNDVRAFRGSC